MSSSPSSLFGAWPQVGGFSSQDYRSVPIPTLCKEFLNASRWYFVGPPPAEGGRALPLFTLRKPRPQNVIKGPPTSTLHAHPIGTSFVAFAHMLARIVLMIGALSLGLAQMTDKEAKKEIQRKAIKEARKEAKKFKKQGFDVTPGSLPMEKQLEYTWIKLYQRDEKGQPIYLSADGNAVAQTRTAAEMQALEAAKLNLAGQLETFIRAIIEANIANAQLTNEEAASVTEFLTAAKNVIVTSISQVDPAFKIYRNLPNKNVEVNVKLLVNRDQVVQEAKKRVREELRERLKGLQDKVDKLLPLQ